MDGMLINAMVQVGSRCSDISASNEYSRLDEESSR